MKYILVIIISFNITNVNSETTETNLQGKFKEAKEIMVKSCIKCGETRSLTKYLVAIKILEEIVGSTQNLGTKHKALELLGDSYAELSYSFYKDNPEKQLEFSIKRRNSIEQILKNSIGIHPKAILNYSGFQKSNKEKLATLKPLLKLQSLLFEAKYLEGNILIKEGEVEKGLESLILAIHLASYAEAHYSGYELAWIMKQHDKMDLAYLILQKSRVKKLTKATMDEMLNRK